MKKNKIRVVQGILLLLIAASAGILIYEMAVVPKQNQEMTKHLKETFPETDTKSPGADFPPEEPALGTGSTPAGEEQQERQISSINFPALQETYPNVKGWLTIPDTGIDYPILQSGEAEPEYYLKRNYRGEADANGSLFLQWNCDVLEGQNLVVYGHNMNSGAMFGNLERYTNPAYCRRYPDIFLQHAQGMEVYQILAVLKADASMFPFQQVKFTEPDSLEAYLQQAKTLSLFETGNSAATATKALTLVTCSYEWQEARTVVVAARR